MNRLHRIVRRIHCSGTHHRFAVDALSLIRTDAGHRLATWLLYHYPSYLRGATDPDLLFRDFHNHWLHIDDGDWGGAPRVAHQWYERLQKHLRAERYQQAAYAAGVLSHYVTDVMQPLHTSSNDRDAVIHRPLEWSIDQSYERILKACRDEKLQAVIDLSDRHGWLGSMMIHAARYAHQKCQRLTDQYRFQAGVRNPTAGLSEPTIGCLAELFAVAITGWSRVLERAAAETESYTGYPIAHCHTHLATVGAVAKTPLALWNRGSRRRRERRFIERLADEYFRTGQLVHWLPAEIDIKRRVIAIRNQERQYRQQQRKAA
ncbi:zinc dependent phospholipase C family protein [Stieleria sp. TO1_6]|uniref:zinc dependent phospholipase C family protein n=1 Tax=Stieleria tagensis TaxID=2956795 RepID=UPI00209B8131|nr:zinc dependent phospholipase C family protein [Stieleria tagensis]MCO8121872.1 zinc dependent phospholipase C family protein [Stieleria tagensis]